MTRVYVPGALAVDSEVELSEAAARHLGQVLRIRSGEGVVLFNGEGGEYEARVTAVERRRVCVHVGRHAAVERESALRITLAQCVSKGDRMDYTVQKAVELGAAAIVPLLSTRSVVRVDSERWEKKLDHWNGVITNACEQAGRTRIPRLEPVRRLDSWLAAAPPGLSLVLVPGGAHTLKTLKPAAEVTFLAGPEGGLAEDEIAQAVRAGFTPVGLGPRILRTETAGVAALAALQTLWGDLG
jgi:16S rRNA (uracil1498-N3)-methyltransferase